MPRHTACSNTKTGIAFVLTSIRLIWPCTTCELVWNHLWTEHILIKTRPWSSTNLTSCSSCIDTSSLCLPSNLFPVQMLTNAKLQITAVISRLIVSIVLGHFLAVASLDTKETVLSANVSAIHLWTCFSSSNSFEKRWLLWRTFTISNSPSWNWNWLALTKIFRLFLFTPNSPGLTISLNFSQLSVAPRTARTASFGTW